VTSCPAGKLSCSGKCIDPNGDDKNCGACGNTCDHGQHCHSGSCKKG
jgi:hypothetical protein